jgi:hypothetical protein
MLGKRVREARRFIVIPSWRGDKRPSWRCRTALRPVSLIALPQLLSPAMPFALLPLARRYQSTEPYGHNPSGVLSLGQLSTGQTHQ